MPSRDDEVPDEWELLREAADDLEDHRDEAGLDVIDIQPHVFVDAENEQENFISVFFTSVNGGSAERIVSKWEKEWDELKQVESSQNSPGVKTNDYTVK